MTMTELEKPAALALSALTFGGQASRWRTEAMRSHDTGRLIHITKGQGRITVAGLTGGYGPNNLIFIPPHTMYGIEVGPTVFGQILTLPSDQLQEYDAPFHLRLLDVVVQKELQNLFEAIERELKPSGDQRAALCYMGLLSIFVERQCRAQQANANDERRRSAAARLVARYTRLIAQDFRHDRSVADYAAALHVTPTHLTRSCKQTCDRSALGLLNDRIHFEACVMLRDTGLPIQDIARSLGFQSAAYFTRSFQARSGQTPSGFRRNNGAGRP